MTTLHSETGQACVPNLGPRQRRIRFASGLIASALAIGTIAVLVALDADRWWRFVLFVPVWGAAIGFLQAREKT